MFCANCGKQLDDSFKFCDGCGASVGPRAAAPAPSAPAETTAAPTFSAEAPAPVAEVTPAAETTPELPSMPAPIPITAAVPIAAATRSCPRCGKQVASDFRFCDGCGAPMSDDVPAISQPAYAVVSPQPRRGGLGIIIAVVVLLLAAGGGVAYWKLAGNGGTSKVDVAITPAEVVVAPGASQTIEAAVTGTDDTDVTWRLQEGAIGGEITPDGATAHDGKVYAAAKYVAPGTPGTYHLIAVSKADPKKAAGVTITVQ